jgi:hypothetical protein
MGRLRARGLSIYRSLDKVSVTPPSSPLSLRRCLSRSLSACLASSSARLVFSFYVASSSAEAFLCCARPSALRSSLPIRAPAASFTLPLALSSISLLRPHFRERLLLVRSARHVLDSDAPSGPRTLHLGEIHTQLLGLLPGGIGGVRLLSASTLLLCRLLSLLGCLSCGVLGLTRHLPGLIGDLPGYLLGLPRRLTGGVLHALCDLPDLIGDSAQGSTALLLASTLLLASAEEPANGVLDSLHGLTGLIGGLPSSLLGLARRLARGVLHPLHGLAGLVSGLPSSLLGLAHRLARGVLGLLSRAPEGLLGLLGSSSGGGALRRLVHHVFQPLVLGRLVEGDFDLRVGVGHLLELGLHLRGGLLGQALQLAAIVLQLALDPAERVPVELLGALHRLLLDLVLQVLCFGHFFTFLS